MPTAHPFQADCPAVVQYFRMQFKMSNLAVNLYELTRVQLPPQHSGRPIARAVSSEASAGDTEAAGLKHIAACGTEAGGEKEPERKRRKKRKSKKKRADR